MLTAQEADMRNVSTVALLLCIAPFSGFAQPLEKPEPTRIGPHHIGETLQEWIAASHELDNLESVCRSRKHWDKERCKHLLDIRDGKLDEIGTGFDDAHGYKWKFIDGSLQQVEVDIPGILSGSSPNIPEEVGFLIQKYGQPSESGTVVYQNSYGAKWDCLRATWTMPDGTFIMAREHIGTIGGFRRELMVIFSSKDALSSQGQTKSNPYDH
jgi:hypothetical protein